MEAIYLLIPIALILVAIGLWIFFWAVKSDQFEDLEGPAHSILFDETSAKKTPPDDDTDNSREASAPSEDVQNNNNRRKD